VREGQVESARPWLERDGRKPSDAHAAAVELEPAFYDRLGETRKDLDSLSARAEAMRKARGVAEVILADEKPPEHKGTRAMGAPVSARTIEGAERKAKPRDARAAGYQTFLMEQARLDRELQNGQVVSCGVMQTTSQSVTRSGRETGASSTYHPCSDLIGSLG
jgi:hypothetical protein